MLFKFADLPPQERYKLLVATVTPRPIAWVVSQDEKGALNAAPFSFFNALCGNPPIVGIGIASHKPGQPKDTRANIKATKQFVVNLVAEENAEAMNITGIEFEHGIDELEEAKLTTTPSTIVKPPRIVESPVAMECELVQIVDLGPDTGLVLGQVVAMHIRDDAVIDPVKNYIDTPKLKLIGRMQGADWYSKSASDVFQMPRISVDEWNKNNKN